MAPCVLSVQELHWVTQSFLIWKHFHQGSRMEPSSWFHFAMRYRLKQLVWTLPPINPVAEWCRSCVFGDKHWHWTCCIGEPAGDCSVALNMSLWCRWCKSAPSLCMKLSSMQKQKGWSFLVLFFPEYCIYESFSPNSLFDNAKSSLQFSVSVCAPSSIFASTEWSSWCCPYKKNK